jgi:hypothetical protein
VGWGGKFSNEIVPGGEKESHFRHTFILTHCNGAGRLPAGRMKAIRKEDTKWEAANSGVEQRKRWLKKRFDVAQPA